MKNKTIDVHTEHCCSKHGCKYGDDTCTVASGEKKPSYSCEICEENKLDKIYIILKLHYGVCTGIESVYETKELAEIKKVNFKKRT